MLHGNYIEREIIHVGLRCKHDDARYGGQRVVQ